MFLPLLRGQRLALERLNVRLLVRVEDFDAADEFLEVVEEVGALVVCRGFRIVSGREREGCFRLSIEELPWTYKRRWSRTRPGPRQTRKGCLRRNNLDSENKERESPKKKKKRRECGRCDLRNLCALRIPSLSNRFKSSDMALYPWMYSKSRAAGPCNLSATSRSV